MRIFLSAGEASGDYHGAMLAQALRRYHPACELRGVGGPRMHEAGVQLAANLADLNVMGLVELLPRLGRLLRIKSGVQRALLSWRPDVTVLIDFPGFNLALAKRLHRSGLRTVYYIPPKLWAWRESRVRLLRECVDQLLVIFPFEVDFYARHGLQAEYVGNPLLDDCQPGSRDVAADPPTLALVPGSRRSEVMRLLPVMLKAVERVRKRWAGARFCLPAAPTIPDEWFSTARAAGVMVERKPLGEVLADCDFAWVASGTAALEAALVGTPMVVAYRMNPLTLLVARRLVKLRHFSLPNILFGEEIVPELLQGEATAERLAAHCVRYIEDTSARMAMRQAFAKLRRSLGAPGAAKRAAVAILQGLEGAGHATD